MNLHDGNKRGVEVVAFRLFGIKHFDRIGSSGDGEDRAFVEILGELFSVEGRRGDDDLEVWSSLYRF